MGMGKKRDGEHAPTTWHTGPCGGPVRAGGLAWACLLLLVLYFKQFYCCPPSF